MADEESNKVVTASTNSDVTLEEGYNWTADGNLMWSEQIVWNREHIKGLIDSSEKANEAYEIATDNSEKIEKIENNVSSLTEELETLSTTVATTAKLGLVKLGTNATNDGGIPVGMNSDDQLFIAEDDIANGVSAIQNAVNTANEAATTANNAANAAATATTKADEAQATAVAAQSSATAAQATATTALTVANGLRSTIEETKETADEAKETADNAASQIDAIKAIAEEAKTTADTAQTTADTANTVSENANATALKAIKLIEDLDIENIGGNWKAIMENTDTSYDIGVFPELSTTKMIYSKYYLPLFTVSDSYIDLSHYTTSTSSAQSFSLFLGNETTNGGGGGALYYSDVSTGTALSHGLRITASANNIFGSPLTLEYKAEEDDQAVRLDQLNDVKNSLLEQYEAWSDMSFVKMSYADYVALCEADEDKEDVLYVCPDAPTIENSIADEVESRKVADEALSAELESIQTQIYSITTDISSLNNSVSEVNQNLASSISQATYSKYGTVKLGTDSVINATNSTAVGIVASGGLSVPVATTDTFGTVRLATGYTDTGTYAVFRSEQVLNVINPILSALEEYGMIDSASAYDSAKVIPASGNSVLYEGSTKLSNSQYLATLATFIAPTNNDSASMYAYYGSFENLGLPSDTTIYPWRMHIRRRSGSELNGTVDLWMRILRWDTDNGAWRVAWQSVNALQFDSFSTTSGTLIGPFELDDVDDQGGIPSGESVLIVFVDSADAETNTAIQFSAGTISGTDGARLAAPDWTSSTQTRQGYCPCLQVEYSTETTTLSVSSLLSRLSALEEAVAAQQ